MRAVLNVLVVVLVGQGIMVSGVMKYIDVASHVGTRRSIETADLRCSHVGYLIFMYVCAFDAVHRLYLRSQSPCWLESS